MNFDQYIASRNGRGGWGTNPSDTGECLGLLNDGERAMRGILYPIKGITYARDFGTGQNTRPDIYKWVANDPKNPNQVPSRGDMIVFKNVGDSRGHVGYVLNAPLGVNRVTIFDQWQGAVAGSRDYNYNSVLGWWHIETNQTNQGVDIMDRQAVIDAYLTVRGSHPSEAEIAGWVGKPAIMLVRGFKNEADQARNNYSTAIKNLQTALANEQAKPPKEVVKEVEKIVEKIVTVEKPVEVVVEPSWLVSVREAIKTFLKIK